MNSEKIENEFSRFVRILTKSITYQNGIDYKNELDDRICRYDDISSITSNNFNTIISWEYLFNQFENLDT